MTKRETYCRFFAIENDAVSLCQLKNRAARRANNCRNIYAVIDGPEDNFAVVDLMTAIDFGAGYSVFD